MKEAVDDASNKIGEFIPRLARSKAPQSDASEVKGLERRRCSVESGADRGEQWRRGIRRDIARGAKSSCDQLILVHNVESRKKTY